MLIMLTIIWILLTCFCLEEYLDRLFPSCKSAIQVMVEESELREEALKSMPIDAPEPPKGQWK